MRKFEFTKDYLEKLRDEFYNSWDDSVSMDFNSEEDYKERYAEALEEFLEEKKDVLSPKRATRGSCGYDFFAVEDIIIPSFFKLLNDAKFKGEKVKPFLIPTGIKCKMPKDNVLMLYPRSSLFKKFGLILSNEVGIIDSDYYSNPNNDGHIMIPVLNLSWDDVKIKKGTRLVQGVFQKYLVTDNDVESSERVGGFGSSDRNLEG